MNLNLLKPKQPLFVHVYVTIVDALEACRVTHDHVLVAYFVWSQHCTNGESRHKRRLLQICIAHKRDARVESGARAS